MSPENDQCRWVGIRPTNPKEDIPITLDGEVAHVIIDSGGGGGIEPTELVMTPYYFTPTVSGVWYTTVNRSDPGWLFFTALQPGAYTKDCFVGVTIDGGARQAVQLYPKTTYILPMFNYNGALTAGVDWFGLRFKTSIKIEYRQDWASWLRGTCLIGYD